MSDDMHDDLDDLKAAFKAVTPAPDAAKRAADIALAQKNFAGLQESGKPARPISERSGMGLIRGVRSMITTLSARGALTATTALLAVGLVVTLPQLTDMPQPDLGGTTRTETDQVSTVAATEAAQAPQVVEEAVSEPVPVPLSEDKRARQDADGGRVALSERTETESFADGTVAGDDTVAQAPGEGSSIIAAAPEPKKEQTFANTSKVQAGAAQGLANRSAAETRSSGLSVVGDIATPLPTPADEVLIRPETDTEAYPDATPSPLKITVEEPVSTFSIDVDTASYAILRSTISSGRLPSPEQVRIEEMINYFPYDYATPEADGHPFRPTVSVVPTPWNQGTQLVHIAIQGRKPVVEDRPPLNLVFLIDTSGSMNQPGKLPLLKQSLSLMLSQLDARDQVAIVTYAGSAGQVLAPTPASERGTILNALARLSAGGSTAGQAGLQQAYSVAEDMAEEGEVTRVILATDGDFNVGLSDPEALKDYIADKRETGSYLSVLGFGRGNLDDATMQALAQNGNGQAAYIDTLSEAQKVLVDQAAGAMFPLANDVKIQVEFNPAMVSEYRLIGYETRALKREDFNNDKVDAGDIGAGHSVTAIYEVTPAGSEAQLVDPLRYGVAAEPEAEAESGLYELGYLKLRYKAPGQSISTLIETPITPGLSEAAGEAGFAIAIAGFGELLKGSAFVDDWGYGDAIALANAAKGEDGFGYRAEAIRLMRLAGSLSEQ